jgi:drug/metabolite transporter (DMT)-like permease
MSEAAASRTSTLTAYGLLTVTAMCWGANTIFAKLAIGEVSPLNLIMWRWAGVVAIAWALAYRDIRREWPLLRKHLGYLTTMGALGFTAFNALFYVAAHSTTALNMGIVQGTIPVFVVIGAYLAFRTPILPKQIIGVGITLLGVLTVAVEGRFERLGGLVFNPGDLMIITACMLYAVYTIWLRKKPQVSALVWFAMLATAAFAASLPVAAVEWLAGDTIWPTQKGWLVIALIVVFPSFLAQVFFIKGVDLIGPGRSGIFVNLVPIIASCLAVLILGEHFQWFHGAALCLVLAGIWIAEHAQT